MRLTLTSVNSHWPLFNLRHSELRATKFYCFRTALNVILIEGIFLVNFTEIIQDFCFHFSNFFLLHHNFQDFVSLLHTLTPPHLKLFDYATFFLSFLKDTIRVFHCLTRTEGISQKLRKFIKSHLVLFFLHFSLKLKKTPLTPPRDWTYSGHSLFLPEFDAFAWGSFWLRVCESSKNLFV